MAIETRILVVDDEKNHADGIAEALENYCKESVAVYNAKDAIEKIGAGGFDIVITDLKLGGDVDGIEILRKAKESDFATEVILMTAYATIDTCKDAIKQGAYDYLPKPVDIDQLRSMVKQIAKSKQVTQTGRSKGFKFGGVVGKSLAMQNIFGVLARVSPTNISVLIEGPSGSGKELLARSIHDNSLRYKNAFKPLNCAGLSETLLESELFGHAKGAFTGALSERKGLFEAADQGTLFLDEIGDMPMPMQAKLLRVLEDGIITPVGSNKQILVDVRVISATNHDLTKLIEQKKFRQDLYFRIKGVSLTVPPLRERPEDIPVFIEHFAKVAASDTGADILGMSESALAILLSYDWPGNIRQLKNCINTMVVMCEGQRLDVADIPPEINQIRRLGAGKNPVTGLGDMPLDQIEKQAIIETLAKTNNNREKAAKILGIGERTLYRKIKEYGL